MQSHHPHARLRGKCPLEFVRRTKGRKLQPIAQTLGLDSRPILRHLLIRPTPERSPKISSGRRHRFDKRFHSFCSVKVADINGATGQSASFDIPRMQRLCTERKSGARHARKAFPVKIRQGRHNPRKARQARNTHPLQPALVAILDANAVRPPTQIRVKIMGLEAGANLRVPTEEREVGKKTRFAGNRRHRTALGEPTNQTISVPKNRQGGVRPKKTFPSDPMDL